MSCVEDKLKHLGIELPEPPKPVAAYVPVVKAGSLLFTSGQLPIAAGEVKYKGRLGEEVDVATGIEAARLCLINCLSVIKSYLGSLDQIDQVIKLTGYVCSASNFYDQPKVLNGASELLMQIFGESGKHARTAVSVSALPLGACVELDLVVSVGR